MIGTLCNRAAAASANTGEEISQLFNVHTIVLHLANALILFVALYFLLYKPVRRFMEQRAAKIAQELDEATEALRQAELQRLAVAEQEAAAQQEMHEAARRGVQEGQMRAREILAAAQTEAGEIKEQAHANAANIVAAAQEEVAQKAAEMSISMAQSLLRRTINAKDQDSLIYDFLQKVQRYEAHETEPTE